jgi:tRNA-splicing ligase RtcB
MSNYSTLEGTKVPVRIWADQNEMEPQALQQLRNVATVPWVDGVAVMPDVHLGYGCTIGTVIASRSAVLPSAVGVDIGCGMSAVRTSLREGDLPDDLGRVRAAMESAIPVGFNAHESAASVKGVREFGDWKGFWGRFRDLHADVQDRESRAMKQMGTLGSGNHFLEVTVSTTGEVWLLLHSGSRNIGKEIAEKHIKIAKALDHNKGLVDPDLAALLTNTPELAAYRHDLFWAQEYAARNRAIMLNLFKGAVQSALPNVPLSFDTAVSAHHNYVAVENYGGAEMLVTRKGAIRAGKGDLGIIPGSMGAASFIVRGLGNDLAYNSASHGAGRKMSRSKAKKVFTAADLAEQTAGVECRKDAGVIDEIPGAYKDIHAVMDQQKDLVEIVAQVKQVVCVKG